MSVTDRELWQQALVRIKQEVAELPAAERQWIGERLARIAVLQEQMHGFFLRADGEAICRRCQGGCCERGKYHLTLVNLLQYLLPGEEPPPPDFHRSCPFLAAGGCQLPLGRRPFNCLSFLCESIDVRLTAGDKAALQGLESELRGLYATFDRRYAGSSLRGLLNRAGRLGTRAFLDRL